jgi:hypothetical protein
VDDVSTGQLFYFLAAVCVYSLSPGVFPVILLYLYMFTHIVQGVAYTIENKILSYVTFVLQFILLFILFIVIMADTWCSFFLYRPFT